jgi:hypothetical protein
MKTYLEAKKLAANKIRNWLQAEYKENYDHAEHINGEKGWGGFIL